MLSGCLAGLEDVEMMMVGGGQAAFFAQQSPASTICMGIHVVSQVSKSLCLAHDMVQVPVSTGGSEILTVLGQTADEKSGLK